MGYPDTFITCERLTSCHYNSVLKRCAQHSFNTAIPMEWYGHLKKLPLADAYKILIALLIFAVSSRGQFRGTGFYIITATVTH